MRAGQGGPVGCGCRKEARMEAPTGRKALGRRLGWRLSQGGGLREELSKTLVGEVRLERAGKRRKEKLEATH